MGSSGEAWSWGARPGGWRLRPRSLCSQSPLWMTWTSPSSGWPRWRRLSMAAPRPTRAASPWVRGCGGRGVGVRWPGWWLEPGPAWRGPRASPLTGLSPPAGGSLLQSSAPVNIPGSLGSSASFHSASPSPPVSLSSHFLQQPQGRLSQSETPFLGTSASHGSLGKKGCGSQAWDGNRAFGRRQGNGVRAGSAGSVSGPCPASLSV